MSSYLVGIAYFSEWLAAHAPEVGAPSGLSRAVLEDYMLWVRHESPWKPATRNQRLLAVRLVLEEQIYRALTILRGEPYGPYADEHQDTSNRSNP